MPTIAQRRALAHPQYATAPAALAPTPAATTAAKVPAPAGSSAAATPLPAMSMERDGATSRIACITDKCAQACFCGMVACCTATACCIDAYMKSKCKELNFLDHA